MVENEFEGTERRVVVGKLKDKDRRQRKKQLLVRLSDDEVERLAEKKESTGLNGAAMVRKWINGQHLPNRSQKQLVGALRQQGGLLKACVEPGRKISREIGEEMLRLGRSMMDIAARIEAKDDGNDDTRRA
jgi:predicted ATP-dependent endonuclease of OLD family